LVAEAAGVPSASTRVVEYTSARSMTMLFPLLAGFLVLRDTPAYLATSLMVAMVRLTQR
jgi:hypothetical protein